MPEGDTIHKIARRIGPVLEGHGIAELRTADLGQVTDAKGWRVESVYAKGKHLLIAFDSSWSMRTHLGMHGRIRIARSAGPTLPRAVFSLTVQPSAGPPKTVVCTRAYRCELIRDGALTSHAKLSRLGPDLLDETVDLDGVVNRASRPSFGNRSIADVLLDQRIAAGIGNVYKSELLFLAGLDPRTPLADIGVDKLRHIYQEAIRLLRFNLKTHRRTTVPTRRRPTPGSPRLWVYGRRGDLCLECDTPIERFVQGDMARSTYWCPTCQE